MRTPIASEAEGGPIHEDDAKANNNSLKLGWQVLSHFGHIEPKLPTPKARDHQAEGYENGLKRQSPQLGTVLIRDLMPTPRASEPGSTSPGYGDSLNDVTQRLAGQTPPKDLLPTPTVAHLRNHDEPIENYEAGVQQWQDGELNGKPGVSLGVEVRRALLPTPLVDDSKNDGRNENRYPTLASTVVQNTWGKYEPAIRRWEQKINTPAPAATIPDGRDGNHRLNPAFAEWLMGIPGRLDRCDLTRAERLKMAGNGVCPQQALLALTILKERIDNEQLAR